MVKTKKTVTLAIFLCVSLVIHYFEGFIPSPVPGIKLGLANCITLTLLMLYGRREAGAVLFARIVMASLFFGGGMQFIYSLSGGILSFSAVCLLKGKVQTLWVLSAASAICHNIGQVAAAAAITQLSFLWWYIFPLTAAAVISGIFTGLVSGFILKNKYILKIY